MRRTWRVHPLVQSVTRVRAVLHQIVPISFLGADGGAGFGRGGGPGAGPGGFGMLARTLTDRSSRPVSPSYRGEDGSCGPHRRQAPAPCQRCRRRRRELI